MCIKQKCYFIYLQRTSGGVLVLYTTALCCSLNLFLAILLLLRYMLTLVAPTGAALHILLYANVMTTKAFLFYLYTQTRFRILTPHLTSLSGFFHTHTNPQRTHTTLQH